MVAKRGQQDRASSKTPPQAPTADETLPALTREAYQAIVTANTDLAAKLAAALTQAMEAQEREKAALDVIDLLKTANAEMAKRLAGTDELATTLTVADVARKVGLRPDQVLSFRLSNESPLTKAIVVTNSGQKLVAGL